jgi:hypothetical protein
MTGTFLTGEVIEEHKVATGETLEGIAAEAGLSWQELAQFNWQTSVPREINAHLKKVVGCTKKTADGKNYMFDDSDDPGIVLVPKKWVAEGLPVNERHTIRVLKTRNLVLRLEDTEEHPIPETKFRVVFEDDSIVQGQLGRAGIALIREAPEGRFAVYYPDSHDVIAKSLAASLRDAFDAGEVMDIFYMLQHPPDIIQRTIAAYEQYHNTYTGEGLIEDIYATVTDEKVLTAVEGLMAYAGVPARHQIEIAQRLDDGSE